MTTPETPPFGTADASFQAAGGTAGIERLVDDFYHAMNQFPQAAGIRAMYPEDLTFATRETGRIPQRLAGRAASLCAKTSVQSAFRNSIHAGRSATPSATPGSTAWPTPLHDSPIPPNSPNTCSSSCAYPPSVFSRRSQRMAAQAHGHNAAQLHHAASSGFDPGGSNARLAASKTSGRPCQP